MESGAQNSSKRKGLIGTMRSSPTPLSAPPASATPWPFAPPPTSTRTPLPRPQRTPSPLACVAAAAVLLLAAPDPCRGAGLAGRVAKKRSRRQRRRRQFAAATSAATTTTAVAAADVVVVNPRIMVEGAFQHAPFDGHAYGFRTKPHRYVVPDRDGRNLGQSTWVDMATCCAATPRDSDMPRDDPNGKAFAPPPARRCISYEERYSFDHAPKTYKDDVAPKGVDKSPCAEQNPAFYKDLSEDTYHPRHAACCAWFKSFMNSAWTEFPDRMSNRILNRVNGDASTSLYERARTMVRSFDEWRSGVCKHLDGTPSDACCVDCMSAQGNKLAKYSGSRTENMCSYFGDGWCSPQHQATISVADDAQAKLRRAKALQQNPSIMVDGAFNHRPVHGLVEQGDPGQVHRDTITTTSVSKTLDLDAGTGQSAVTQRTLESIVKTPVAPGAVPYVARAGGSEVPIPDHDGRATGQLSWVEIARCCAATPQSSDSPLDTPNAAAFAAQPAERCIESSEPQNIRTVFGNNRGPCRRENAGYFKTADGTYKPRYSACCTYMKDFLAGASHEFPDPASQLVLSTLAPDRHATAHSNDESGGLSIYSQSLSLVTHFNMWNKGICTDAMGSPSGRCCNDCIEPAVNKLERFTGLVALKTCSSSGEGWCTKGQGIPQGLLSQLKEDTTSYMMLPNNITGPVADAMLSSTVVKGNISVPGSSETGATAGGATGGSRQGATGVGDVTATGPSSGEPARPEGVQGEQNANEMKDQSGMPAPTAPEDTVPRLRQLEDENMALQKRTEKVSQRAGLGESVRAILDRAKLTLLSEKVGLRQMMAEAQAGSPEIDAKTKMARFASVNKELPSLLDNVETFVTSGQAMALLEQEEEYDSTR